jgi:hypothetical protein
MNTTRKFAAYALTAFLIGGSAGGVAVAQTGGTPSATSPGTTTSVPATNRDNDWDWGWLGLLGLIGLAGLMRRDRAHHDTRHPAGMGTTTSAR